MTALSRTLMLTTWPQEKPPQPSPRSGPSGLRARVGFRPNTPEAEAGIRIEPPPSLACATGRMRAATAAAAPPDDPPEECARFQGLRVGPCRRDSVVGIRPNSGLELLPKIETPAIEKALHQRAVVVGDKILQDRGAGGRARALEGIEVLQEERHAGKGAVGQAALDLALGVVVMLDDDGVDLRIDLRGTGDGLVEQFPGRDLFVANQFGKADRVVIAIFLEGHAHTSLAGRSVNRPRRGS